MRSVDRLSPAYRAYIQRLGKTHAVESHEDGRRRQLTRLFVEEVEPRDELLIETRDLTDRKSCVQGFRSDLARGVGHGLPLCRTRKSVHSSGCNHRKMAQGTGHPIPGH